MKLVGSYLKGGNITLKRKKQKQNIIFQDHLFYPLKMHVIEPTLKG